MIKNFKTFCAVLMLLAVCSTGGYCAPTSLDADGGVRLNGNRWFPIGLYAPPDDEAGLRGIADMGFNIVLSPADIARIDQIKNAGLQAWIPLGGDALVADSAAEGKLAEKIKSLMAHEGVAIYEFPDEALWNVSYGRHEVFWAQKREAKDILDKKIAAGEDAAASKAVYRELIAAESIHDCAAMDLKLRELWKSLGQPDKDPGVTLADIPREEEALYQKLLAGYRAIRKADPNHLVWQNHAPRNTIDLLKKHADYCDLIGCDIYPFPENLLVGHSDLADRTLASVGAYTQRFRDLAPDKGVFMVLQGFAWRDLNPVPEEYKDTPHGEPPTYIASRFMAYDSIVKGANGIFYWGTAYRGEKQTAWKNLVPVIQEISKLGQFLAAPEVKVPLKIESTPSWSSLDLGVACSVRKSGDDWLLIMVNETNSSQTVQVEFPAIFEGKRFYFLYENLFVDPVSKGYFPLAFSPYGVKILSTRNDLEHKDAQGLNRMFSEPF